MVKLAVHPLLSLLCVVRGWGGDLYINGGRNKLVMLIEMMRNKSIDVLFLQEPRSSVNRLVEVQPFSSLSLCL